MMGFRSFDNFDDMMRFMRTQEAIANAAVTDEQRSIGYGDYWVREWEDIVIYGYIPTPDEIDADERDLGADDDELAYEREVLDDSYSRGYRFGRAFSVVEPDGEWGSTHISVMRKISADEFEAARILGWDV